MTDPEEIAAMEMSSMNKIEGLNRRIRDAWLDFSGRTEALSQSACFDAGYRAALEAPAVPEWQPIETAPKDSTRILLARIAPMVDTDGLAYGSEAWKERMFSGEPTKIHLWWAIAGFWSDKWNNWNDGVEPSGLADPTHWMPLPPPPTEPGEYRP